MSQVIGFNIFIFIWHILDHFNTYVWYKAIKLKASFSQCPSVVRGCVSTNGHHRTLSLSLLLQTAGSVSLYFRVRRPKGI